MATISSSAKKFIDADIAEEIAVIDGIKKSITKLNNQLEAREFKLNLMLEAVGAKREDYFPAGARVLQASTSMSFRDTIRGILRASGDYMTVREIADALDRINYRYTGTTEITTRLGNDLSRMVMQGNVLKSSRQDGGRSFVVYKLQEDK